jgi:hypothetical protein
LREQHLRKLTKMMKIGGVVEGRVERCGRIAQFSTLLGALAFH